MAMQTLHEGYWVKSESLTYSLTGATTPVIDVPAGTLVTEVKFVITTAFSGGTPSIDIGDGDDDDGWIDSTEITEGTAGCYSGPGTAGHSVYTVAGGKYYSSADTIDFKESGGACTAGVGRVFAHFLRMDEA